MGTKNLVDTPVKQEVTEHNCYVLVHRGRITIDEHPWSILVVKSNGDVFKSSQISPTAGKTEEGGVTVGEFTRVGPLCGLNVRKLAVQRDFGLALSFDGTLYKWEGELGVPREAIIMVQSYSDGPCHCGRSEGGRLERCCRSDLLRCPHGSSLKPFKSYYLSDPPATGVKVCRFIIYSRAQVLCPECKRPCARSTYSYGGFYVNICNPCHRYADAGDLAKCVTPVRDLCKLDSCIMDVDAGDEFFCALSKDFEVKLHLNCKSTSIPCVLRGGDRAKSVSCGSNHIAVITQAGDIHSYDDLDGDDVMVAMSQITLVKLNLPGRALEVCCWKSSTACLLVDKSVYLFQGGVPSVLIAAPWFFNCSIKPILEELPIADWSAAFPKIHGQDSSAFWNLSISDSKLRGSVPPEINKTSTQQILNLHTIQKTLYACNSLSDLTLKLADEEFPAHWVILISTSQYFKEIFRTGVIPSTLDMTSYNPRAYKCLLQHFYQVTPEELPVSDLIDMLEIASSYEEKHIVSVIVQSLEDQIQAENVLKILSKARSLANLELIKACEKFIRSASFKDYFAELCINDPAKFQ